MKAPSHGNLRASMPATLAATTKQKAGAPIHEPAQPTSDDSNKTVRLHIAPFNPALLKVYLAPSVLPTAKNISYHTIETFPEKGFGYVELPVMEAQKLKKKLNGSTLKGSKVRIEDAKPEKRKVLEAERAEPEEEERPAKRAKKDKKKKKKEDGVLEGVELPDQRKVKRGWTEVPVKGKKDRKEKKEKDKDGKKQRKESKYTKDPEVLFKAKLTPVAAAEVARKEKKDKKKEKKDKNKSKHEVVVHEFEKNTKTPSFLKATKVSTDQTGAVDYVNGKGWLDENGDVVEAETSKAKNRRVLELVEPGPEKPTSRSKKQVPVTPSPKAKKGKKATKKVTPPPESEESESEESSVVSSSSEDDDSDSESEASAVGSEPASPTTPVAHQSESKAKSNTTEITITPSSPSPAKKEIHPLEALFKKPKPSPIRTPGSNPTSTPAKNLAPINTTFSFFGDVDGDVDMEDQDAEGGAEGGVPFTPQTQRDIEWRGLRSAAPTPDTAAIGRRFSFPWRNGSQEIDEVDDEEEPNSEANTQLINNTKANATSSQLADVVEEDEEVDAVAGVDQEEGGEGEGEKEESEFRKWFWENQGNLNRAWKRRRKDAVKTKRSVENRRAAGGARRGA